MMRNERGMRFLMATIVVLLTANLLVSINGGVNTRSAMAQGIPDQGAQLNSVISQLQDLNKKVSGLQTYLESGSLTVKSPDVVNALKTKETK